MPNIWLANAGHMRKYAGMAHTNLDMAPMRQVEREIEEKIGYAFADAGLLILALTHSSWANENGREHQHNQRLEFLGDAVLELCVSDELFHRYPEAREGPLTEMRAGIVSEQSLAELARHLGLDAGMRLGRGEEMQRGRQKDSLLADVFEAVLAAVYEDGGYAAARNVVRHVFAPLWPATVKTAKDRDPKSRLQEACQKMFREVPVYTLRSATGPEHAKIFDVSLCLPNGKHYYATNTSCKKAEQAAAANALAALGLD